MVRLTPVVKNLLIINVAVFMLQSLLGSDAYVLGAMWDIRSDFWAPYQYFTHMFMHGGFMHLLFNMIGLLFLGPALESVMGDRKFLLYYMVCGLGAGIIHTIASYYTTPVEMVNLIPMIGASGAISGILMAAALYFPNAEVIVFPIPVPVKIKYLVLFMVGYELLTGLGITADYRGTNIANFAHFGGFLIGFIFLKFGNFNFNGRR